MGIGRNIKALRENAGMSQSELAKIVGVTDKAVSTWENETRIPRMGAIQKVADYFGLDKTDIISDELVEEKQPSLPLNMTPYKPTGQVPILGTIPAGIASLAVEDVEGYITVDVRNPEECFALRVKGDSMINAGIFPGDIVIVRTQNHAENGQIVACRINGDESTLKRFTRQGDTVVLAPENPQYPMQIVKASDFEDGSASIIGVALQAVKML